MDTKSRNIRYSVWFKVLALALAIAGSYLIACGFTFYNSLLTVLEPGNYLYTSQMSSWFNNILSTVEQADLTYGSEEEILSDENRAKAVDATQESMWRDEAQSDVSSIEEEYASYIQEAFNTNDDEESRDKKVKELEAERDQKIAARQQQLVTDLDDAREQVVQQQLKQYRNAREELAALGDGILYGWRNADGYSGGNTNLRDDALEQAVKACPVYYIKAAGSREETNLPELSYGRVTLSNENNTLWLGITQEAYGKRLSAWVDDWAQGRTGMTLLGVGCLLTLLGLGWLCVAAGRRPAQEGVVLLAVDHLPLDIGLVLPIGAGYAGVGAWSLYIYNEAVLRQGVSVLPLIGIGLLLALAVSLLALYLTMFSKRLKRHEVLRHTAVAWVLRQAGRGLRTLLQLVTGGPVPLRAALVAVGLVGFTLLGGAFAVNSAYYAAGFKAFLWVVFVAAVDLLAGLWLIRRFQRLLRGVDRIRGGDIRYRLPAGGDSLTAQLGDRINHIADGLNTAVEREVRSERMKSELVTNVSHDLKTPLTSLITYLDLLEKEGLQSDKAPHYLEVLQAKAQRLKVLTEDLVEAARAASGAVAVQRERLDLTALLQQSLGEYEARLTAAELTVRFTAPGERITVLADGRLLWRVVDNLLGNVCKYALPGSRVYVDVGREGDRVRFTMKNISAQELNMPAEELTERFVRGDEARTTEGSGLGLSIAKNLTELMDGTFTLTVDGDLFKAAITVPAAPPVTEPSPGQP